MSKEHLFNSWMNQVDSYIQKTTGGLCAGDMMDKNYREAFDQNLNADDVAQLVLAENGFEF